MHILFNYNIERNDEEIELAVIYDVTPFIPARLYGDYPQPAEGGEVDVISVRHLSELFILTDAEHDALHQVCEERAEADVASELEDAAECRAEGRYNEFRERSWS